MSTINKGRKGLKTLRKKYYSKATLRRVIPAIQIIIFLIYYLPMYGIVFLPSEKLYVLADLYEVVNPYSVAPIIVGGFLIFAFIFYTGLIFRSVFCAMYAASIFFSIVAMMKYTSGVNFCPYPVHLVIVCIILVIKILEVEKE